MNPTRSHILPESLKNTCLAVFALSSIVLTAPIVTAQVKPQSTIPSSQKARTVPEVVSAVRPSVVTIMPHGVRPNAFQHPSAAGLGSGFIVDPEGHILTNNHFLEGIQSLVVRLSNGRLIPGRVVGRDFLLDLAVVKIQAKDLVAADLGRSSSLQIGETVVAIGNPTKGGSTVTVGVVSAINRSILPPNGETLYDLVQTDAAINPGNSGSPLVDLSGRVVGINTAVAPSAQAISYAISIDAAYPHIQSMIVRGTVMRPDLGFIPLTVTPNIAYSFNVGATRGVLAVQVEPSKLVSQYGIANGDVITAVDDAQVYNTGDFWHAFLSPDGKDPMTLTVYGKNGQISVSLPRVKSPRVSR